MQSAGQCWCGNKYHQQGIQKVSDSECNRTCPGNSGQKCGADWRNSIYVASETRIGKNLILELFCSGRKYKSEYMGCYVDTVDRDISFKAYEQSDNSVFKCQNECRNRGFKFAGVQS